MLVALSAFWSCGHRGYDSRLLIAESIITDRPDSSLAILDSLSLSGLHRESDRALYAMLVTQALEKLHLKPTDDSLIAIATDYYDRHDDAERQAISHYYRGIVQYNDGRYSPAIVHFFQARDIAGKNDMDFWNGLACRGISDIYNKTYNSVEELNFAREEFEYTKRSGRQPYLNYALLDLARALCNTNDADGSKKLLSQVLDSAKAYDDKYLEYGAKQLIVINLLLQSKEYEAYPVILDILEFPYSDRSDSFLLADTYVGIGKFDEAERLINNMEVKANDEKLSKMSLLAMLYAESSDYKNAFIASDSAFILTNIEFRDNTSNTLASNIAEYFNIKEKHKEILIQKSRLKNWLILVTSIFLIIIVVFVSVILYQRQKRNIEEKVLFAEQLKSDITRLKNESVVSVDIIQKLMTSKYQLLDELSSIMMQSSDSRTARRKIADAVTGIINDLTIGSGKIAQFEDEVNRNYDGLFDDFKNDLPNLKEADYRLFLFSVLGLSNSVISLFLKEDKIEAIYNRRRRLKNKISDLDETKKERYLKFL
ncbi:MAG: hypothetical protein K2H48_01895 [Duncaniella sp.]|nr:hypothetical protein [Duncaniella sp.]